VLIGPERINKKCRRVDSSRFYILFRHVKKSVVPVRRHSQFGQILTFIIAFSLSACQSTSLPVAPPTGMRGDFPNHNVSEILERLPVRPDAFSELYAEMSVALSSPEEKGRFTTRIAYRQGDSLLIRVRVKLGIEAARVLITEDSAFVYNRIDNELIYGLEESIAPLLPGAVLGTDLIDASLGYIIPDADVDWRVESDALRYSLISPDNLVRYVVDPDFWRVIYIEKKDAEGTIIEQRWYNDFRLYNQHMLPRRLQLSRPPEDTRLSMSLLKVDTEPEDLSFDLGLKDDTRRILVK